MVKKIKDSETKEEKYIVTKNKIRFFHAAHQGKIKEMRKLLWWHPSLLQAQDLNGATALFYAAESKSLEAVKFLVHKGLKINHSTSKKLTPLFCAANSGNIDVLSYLITHGADVNHQYHYGRTALFIAAARGDIGILSSLLQHKLDINHKDRSGMTILFEAACCGHIAMVEYLLHQDMNIHHKDQQGRTALFLAAQNGHIGVAEYLLESGANLNETDNHNRTTLFAAAASGIVETLQYFVRQGLDQEHQDKFGKTALDYMPPPMKNSAHRGKYQVIKPQGPLIVEPTRHGANIIPTHITPEYKLRDQVDELSLKLKQMLDINQSYLSEMASLEKKLITKEEVISNLSTVLAKFIGNSKNIELDVSINKWVDKTSQPNKAIKARE